MSHKSYSVPSSNARAAVAYAQQGLWVFPLSPGSKVPPKGSVGVNGASNDVEQVKKWWKNTPDANIGIALQKSGLMCIDLDVKPAKGIDGRVAFRGLELLYGAPALGVCHQITPSGGEHHVVRWQPGIIDKVGWVPGVDILSSGHRYIVAAPSRINGALYQWSANPLLSTSAQSMSRDWALLLKAGPSQGCQTNSKTAHVSQVERELLGEEVDSHELLLDAATLKVVGVTLEELKSVLDALDPSMGRDDWLRVLWGAAAQWARTKDESEVIQILEDWSSKTEKADQYRQGEVAERWAEHVAGHGRNGAGHVTWRTVRQMAKKEGWSSFSLGGINANNWEDHIDKKKFQEENTATGEMEWKEQIRPNAWNCSLFLAFHKSLAGSIKRNMLTLTNEMHSAVVCPLRDSTRLPIVYDKDSDWPGIGQVLKGAMGLSVSAEAIAPAVKSAAQVHAYDPMRDWVESLVWDGKPRITNWLHTVTGCEDSELNRAIGRAWLIGLAARATTDYEGPGTKMDSVLVLQGNEGIGKSTVGAILGGEWYAAFSNSIDDDDIYYVIERAMVMEFDELDSMNRSEASRVKSLITTQADVFRRKYGDAATSKPRRCVFIGTTNDSQFLTKDMTVRRWWVVKCGKKDFALDWLRANRDQLIAEAKAERDAGAIPILSKQLREVHRISVADAQVDHPYEEAARAWSEKKKVGDSATMQEASEGALGRALTGLSMSELRKFGDVMRSVGWEKKRGEFCNFWVKRF